MLAYPYLIGRSKNIGNRRVLGPDFAEQRDVARILLQAAKNTGRPKYLKVTGNSSIGRITFFSLLHEARARDIGADGDDVLRDNVGRPIFLVRGLIFVGDAPSNEITQAHFDYCQRRFDEYFVRFWEAEKWPVSQSVSNLPIDLSDCIPSLPLEWSSTEMVEADIVLSPSAEKTKSNEGPNFAAIGVLGGAVALLLAVIMFVLDRAAKLGDS